MASIAAMQAQRDTLTEARNGGVLSVRYPDGSGVTYRSDAELVAAIAALDRDIAAAQGVRRPSRIYFQTSKGLDHA